MKDYIICQICGEKVSRIYGAHLKRHNMESNEYKEKYPGQPLMCKSDKENTSKNSGLHMKEEKYKIIFSEKVKGEKNPNHKTNTTEEERKERSPFSENFYKKKGSKNIDKDLKEFRENALKDREFDSRIEYYLERGYSLKDSKKKLKERQRTFSMKICKEKYGDIKGLEIYNNRQTKWLESLVNNGNLKNGYSEISQILFNEICLINNLENDDNIFYATKNKEFHLTNNHGYYLYDFTDINNKKIIEYNGDLFHANPKLYEENDTPHPFRKNILAKDLWLKDYMKIKTANDEGFDVLTIWDSEYKKNKMETIQKCLDFLNK